MGGPLRNVPAGEVVFREGEISGEMYRLTSGAIEITKTIGSKDVPINRLGPGAIFGAIGMLQGTSRTATAKALEDSTLEIIDGAGLEDAIDADPAFGVQLSKHLAEMGARLRVELIALGESPERAREALELAAAEIEFEGRG